MAVGERTAVDPEYAGSSGGSIERLAFVAKGEAPPPAKRGPHPLAGDVTPRDALQEVKLRVVHHDDPEKLGVGTVYREWYAFAVSFVCQAEPDAAYTPCTAIASGERAKVLAVPEDEDDARFQALADEAHVAFSQSPNGESHARFLVLPGETSPDTLRFTGGLVRYKDVEDEKVFYVADGAPVEDEPLPVRIFVHRHPLTQRTVTQGSAVLEIEPLAEILLGETKYYQAVVDPEDTAKLNIREVTVDDCQAPQLEGGASEATFTVAIESGDKLGVYYDTERWGCVQSNGTVGGGVLPSGVIRVTGRFWTASPDLTYKVRLTASIAGATGKMIIKVTKPTSLGTGNTSAGFFQRTTRDVFDQVLDIDSLSIAVGGRYGVPPQFLKAQIRKEAAYISGLGWAPSYRYEPYTAQFWPEVSTATNNPYYVTTRCAIVQGMCIGRIWGRIATFPSWKQHLVLGRRMAAL